MKRFAGVLSCFVWLCSFVNAAEQSPNTLSAEEKAEGFVLLFDGKQLSPEIWQGAIDDYPVEQGELVFRKGAVGNLLPRKEYEGFVLRYEFQLPPGGNNGVALWAARPKEGKELIWMEIQILDNSSDKYKGLEDCRYNGSIVGIVSAKRNAEKLDFLKPVGEWNYQEITARGSKIKIVQNGETILDADLDEFKTKPTADGIVRPAVHHRKGLVGFLGHYDPVRFRNIRIKELPTL
ncbi:MAG: DUF1080 domain-containing protein [Planctomycetaceae bacterium]|jgi:hypothetical protein|nr:DUF1080 domain-containing protein [Planctomycetaceae bacterium]